MQFFLLPDLPVYIWVIMTLNRIQTSYHRRDPTLYAWCVLHMITRSTYGTLQIYRRCAHVPRTERAISIISTFHCRFTQTLIMFKMFKTFKRIIMFLEKNVHVKLNSLKTHYFFLIVLQKTKCLKVLRIVFNFLILVVWCAYDRRFKGLRKINIIHTFWSECIQDNIYKAFYNLSYFFFFYQK